MTIAKIVATAAVGLGLGLIAAGCGDLRDDHPELPSSYDDYRYRVVSKAGGKDTTLYFLGEPVYKGNFVCFPDSAGIKETRGKDEYIPPGFCFTGADDRVWVYPIDNQSNK